MRRITKPSGVSRRPELNDPGTQFVTKFRKYKRKTHSPFRGGNYHTGK
jgi:hypothetical protein